MTLVSQLSQLDHLHDAEVHSVSWDMTPTGMRKCRMKITVNNASPATIWNGDNIHLLLSNVAVCRMFVYGLQLGKSTIDFIKPTISNDLFEECNRLCQYGIPKPEFQFTIVFTDGCLLEVACGEMIVEDVAIAQNSR